MELRNKLCRLLEIAQEKLSPPKQDLSFERLIYTMGSADPRPFSKLTKGYNSFSGCDIKIIIDGKTSAATQSLCCDEYIDEEGKRQVSGSASFIVFDKPFDYLGKTVRLIANGADEYGNFATFFDEEVTFISKKYELSIENVVVEEHYTFKMKTKDE